MKQVLLFLSFIFVVALSASYAQPLLYSGEMGPDTVNASETIYHYPNGTSFATARRFKDLGNMNIACKLDSLSGTPNVTTTLQVAYDLLGTFWVDVDTVTTTNMGTAHSKTFQFDTYNIDDGGSTFIPTWYRIKYVGSGTQAVKAQDVYVFKKRL